MSGGYIYAGPGNRGTWQTDWKEFLPRFGLAYQLDSKTVIRGGAGIFYDSLGVGRNHCRFRTVSRATPTSTPRWTAA